MEIVGGTFIDAELDALRLEQEFEMEDECRIYRVSSKATLQPDGTLGSDTEVEVYSGLCSMAVITARRDRFDEFAGGLIFTVQYRLTLPWDCTGVRITDRVTMTTTRDPDFTGRNFEVRDIHRDSDTSQRRLTVHDIER